MNDAAQRLFTMPEIPDPPERWTDFRLEWRCSTSPPARTRQVARQTDVERRDRPALRRTPLGWAEVAGERKQAA